MLKTVHRLRRQQWITTVNAILSGGLRILSMSPRSGMICASFTSWSCTRRLAICNAGRSSAWGRGVEDFCREDEAFCDAEGRLWKPNGPEPAKEEEKAMADTARRTRRTTHKDFVRPNQGKSDHVWADVQSASDLSLSESSVVCRVLRRARLLLHEVPSY